MAQRTVSKRLTDSWKQSLRQTRTAIRENRSPVHVGLEKTRLLAIVTHMKCRVADDSNPDV